jgi:hypothetical protein
MYIQVSGIYIKIIISPRRGCSHIFYVKKIRLWSDRVLVFSFIITNIKVAKTHRIIHQLLSYNCHSRKQTNLVITGVEGKIRVDT